MAQKSNSVRNKLIEITGQGLLLKAIAVNVGISEGDLSRFKGGMNCLKESDVDRLFEWLNKVVIPQWGRTTLETKQKKKEEKESSLDILNEFL